MNSMQPLLPLPVLTSDLLLVIRGTSIFLAQVGELLEAISPGNSSLDFSISGNFGLAAGAM